MAPHSAVFDTVTVWGPASVTYTRCFIAVTVDGPTRGA
jgi:hypothetical protein